MSWALAAVALVLLVVATGVAAGQRRSAGRTLSEARTETEGLATQLRDAQSALARRAADLEDARRQLTDANAQLSAVQQAPEPAPEPFGAAYLEVLWRLTVFELDRAWSLDHAGPPTAGPGTAGVASVVGSEVDRIREETGTPGTLVADLRPEPTAPVAETVWRAARALLGVLVRHTQAYDVELGRRGRAIVVTVLCEGWDGPESVADDLSDLSAVLGGGGITLEVGQDPAGRVRASVDIPESA